VVTDEAAGTAGMTLVERPEPVPAINDVVVEVHASGFTSGGGGLAEYVAIEARVAPLPGDVDFTVGATLPISGLTAWQGLFEHGRLQAGQGVLVHGAAGSVGSMVTQLVG
jgi:NADPH:quinone reductase-like Zn-dependent oxidoreductase